MLIGCARQKDTANVPVTEIQASPVPALNSLLLKADITDTSQFQAWRVLLWKDVDSIFR